MSIDVCHTPNRSNEQIERAFVSMYNKVRQNEKSLIDETIAQLQMLKVRINRGNDEIMQIDKDISVLSAQESLFTTLYSENSFNEDLYFENCITKRARKNRGEMPKYLVSNNHPAIIDRDTFKQVQSEMAKRRSRPRVSDKTITAKGKFSGKYPFSDLLVCDSCGNRYRRCMWISGGKKKIVWRCITRIEHGGKACESISVGDELIHKAVYRSINGYIQNNSGALDIVLSELSKQFGGNDYTDDLCNIERSINELNKQMEDAAMIEVTTQGNKERIREEIIELSQRIVALRNEKSIIEEKMTTAKTRNEELSRFSKELSLYNADCSEITDNKLRRIIQEVRIKKDHTIIIELKNGMLLEEAL